MLKGNQNLQFDDIITSMEEVVTTVMQNEKPTNLLINETTKQLQVPLIYKVDSDGDRTIKAHFLPPYQNNDLFIADVLATYEQQIRPYEEPLEELNEVFAINTEEMSVKYIQHILEESIDPKEKSQFYKEELEKIFKDIVTKDVEQASLRLSSDQLIGVGQFNYITGEIDGFKVDVSQQVLDTVYFDCQKISDEEFEKLLNEVILPDDTKIDENPQIAASSLYDEHKMIHGFLESSKKYVTNPRTDQEEEINDLRNLDIDQIMQRKKDQAKQLKDRQEKVQDLNKISHQPIQDNLDLSLNQLIDGQQVEDEIDFIVQDSSQLREALEKNQMQQQLPELNLVASMSTNSNVISQDAPLRKQWYVIDEIDMKRFKEMIPNPAIEYDFELDDFQKRALYRLEQNKCVFVAAHTSAGKTVVAEYAIALAFKHMTKTIYTSPIKALSNQKFRDFKEKFTDVGIKTGDVTLNGSASCVVMTTEILQMMLYNESDFLKDVEWVIFDEVHYINDFERGTVWEEIIMKLPDHISFVMLSATVPNYKEFADWVGRTKKKEIYVQMTEKRPVPLQHTLLYKDKFSVIKDELNNMNRDSLKKILQEEKKDSFKMRDEKNKGIKPKEEKQEEAKFEKKKEIDFKEKALKAKENQIKKTAMKAQKSGGNGGGGQGPNSQNKSNKKYEKFHKYLISISRDKLLPCVVFCFSRAACVEIPNQLQESLEFTTGQEKGEIKKFLKSKLQRLNESDRNLPQIQNIKSLLIRGIGYHHAGMLPIVKEIVEILFADGYLKVIFATTTFAIGLNMPARSVMFTQLFKFNGTESLILEASEYLQMAGRAGRRGKDTTGTCILTLDRAFGKVPDAEEFEEILTSKGTHLESKLKLSYQMALNVVKSEDVMINDLLKLSFFENEAEKERQKATVKAQWLQVRIQRAEHLECVQVLSPKYFFEKVVVLQQLEKNQEDFLCLLIRNNQYKPEIYNDEEEAKDQKKSSGVFGNFYYEYVRISPANVFRIYENFAEIGYKLTLHQERLPERPLKDIISVVSKFQVFKDWKLSPACNSYIKDKQNHMETLRTLPCFQCNLVIKHLGQIEALKKYESEMRQCKDLMGAGGQEKLDDFKAKVQVLIHYKYIDYELNMLFKGKVSELITNNKFLLTELIFSGLLKELNNEEIIALLSILDTQVGNSKADESDAFISETFQKAVSFLNEEALKLIEVEGRFGVQDAVSEISKYLNFQFYELLFEWASQKPFVEIVKIAAVSEGDVVKVVQNVERLLRQVKNASRVIGDAQLAERMDQCTLLIKRDIIFTPSLYLE
eukprot:403341578